MTGGSAVARPRRYVETPDRAEARSLHPIRANRSIRGRRARSISMPVRSLGWKSLLCALGIAASCCVAAAQSAPPPPAVSVTPVVSRQVTQTIDYIGRITAVDKVDI